MMAAARTPVAERVRQQRGTQGHAPDPSVGGLDVRTSEAKERIDVADNSIDIPLQLTEWHPHSRRVVGRSSMTRPGGGTTYTYLLRRVLWAAPNEKHQVFLGRRSGWRACRFKSRSLAESTVFRGVEQRHGWR
jgi:hypothetical protein